MTRCKPNGDSIGPDRSLLRIARNAIEIAGLDYHQGTVVTVSHITKTAGMKRWLGQSIDAAAVDFKNHAVAAAATAAGIPWISALSVLDARNIDVPVAIAAGRSKPRERELYSYAKHLSTAPLDLPELLRLARASAKATSSLTTFMTSFMEAHSAVTTAERIALTT